MKRSDPSGSGALLVCNFSSEAQSIPVAGMTRDPGGWHCGQAMRIYGGSSRDPRPVETLAAGSQSQLSLAGFEAAIFVS